jgi:ring-1,2-phenylacetyl-CoA epoxidase subunit PaaE
MSQFHRLAVADLRRETADAVSIAFAVPAELRAAFAFTPGQYLTLRAMLDGTEVRRSYSICSAPADGELRVAIKHVPGGAFSTFANTELRTGDMLDVMPPEGRFALPADSRTTLALAAGSGITPVLSIAKAVLAGDPTARFVLLYGSRSTADILFRGALEDLKDRHLGRLTVQHVLSREQQDVPALNGRLDDAKLRLLLPGLIDPATLDAALLCGPDSMIDTLGATLAALGLSADRIHSERFTPAPGTAPRRRGPVVTDTPFATATIIAEGRATQIPLAEGEAVLDAALRAGLDLPWSCRGGMCSTCRARITEGTVRMDVNFSLEPWETDQGYALTCQSHPTTPHITVDYDQV